MWTEIGIPLGEAGGASSFRVPFLGRRYDLLVRFVHTRSKGVEMFVSDMARAGNQTAEQVEAGFFEHVRPSSLLKRFAEVEEVASMVTYISSPLASATNGAALRVDGGVVRSIL